MSPREEEVALSCFRGPGEIRRKGAEEQEEREEKIGGGGGGGGGEWRIGREKRGGGRARVYELKNIFGWWNSKKT